MLNHISHTGRKRILRRVVCTSIAVVCLLILIFTFKIIFCFGASMEPTLSSGQLFVVQKCNAFTTPQRGDIAVIRYPEGGKILIKRLIAFPGDTLEIRSNQVYVNGIALEETYLGEPMVTKDIAPMRLGPDQYYVLGDNRNISADSRLYGLFSGADIVGVVDLNAQLLHWILCLGLVGAIILFFVYLPDWDTPIIQPPIQATQEVSCATQHC